MNLRKNNGFTGIDISIAMLIILVFIPTVFGIVYNIQKTNNSIKRESNAINITTSILETAKFFGYNDLSLDSSSAFMVDMNKKYETSNYVNTSKYKDNYEYVAFSTTDNDDTHYQIQIGMEKTTMENQSLIKVIHVIVYYPIGKNVKSIDISTSIPAT